jgi:DNA-binding response OmpR family regulator
VVLKEKKVKIPSFRVLVVDDDELIRELVVSVLSQKGHHCITALDGVDALRQFSVNRIDAVIADIVMPRMDGITLTKELLKQNPKLPIMVITGHDNEYSSASAIGAGAHEFIKKPFSIGEFTIRFHKMMLDHHRLVTIDSKRDEIIFHTERKSLEKIRILEEEIENLKNRLNSKYFSR